MTPGGCRKGQPPELHGRCAARGAEPLYEDFCGALRELRVPVAQGVFGARMQVELVNDGPVTLILEV